MTKTAEDEESFRVLKEWVHDRDWTQLDPELLAHFDAQGPLGPMIRHPLVHEVSLVSVQHCNRMLAEKQRGVAEALAERDWQSYLWLHARPYRFDALETLVDEGKIAAGSDEHKALLRMVWVDVELPHQYGYARLIRAFRRAGFVGAGKPEREITVYRGMSDYRYAGGISWTLELATARWFAKRFGREQEHGIVLAAEVRPRGVLAVLHDRDESEIVVVPRMLRNVRTEE